jgi:hypothetical protein
MNIGWGRLRSRTFDQLATGRDNNLNLLRMVAASSVLFSHSYALTGHMLEEPLVVASGQRTDAATIGVVVFFAISGFLIAQSLARSRSLYAYAVARGLRIVPGLAWAKLICVFGLGWYATTLSTSGYFQHEDTWKFLSATPFFGIRELDPALFCGTVWRGSAPDPSPKQSGVKPPHSKEPCAISVPRVHAAPCLTADTASSPAGWSPAPAAVAR